MYKDIHNGVFAVSGLDSREGEEPYSLLEVGMWMLCSKFWSVCIADEDYGRMSCSDLRICSAIYVWAIWSVHHQWDAGMRFQHTPFPFTIFFGLIMHKIISIIVHCDT
jgi:hypothetical protein